jgi:hypothetical protein
VRLVGLTHLEEAIRNRQESAGVLRAWRSEMCHRSWETAEALASSFRGADVSDLPTATFYVGSLPLRIDTLLDMHAGVVLVTAVVAVHK